MASASSSSLDLEEPATINFEIVNENKNNNNRQLFDLANRENDFWAQPQEEIFYSPQPLSALVGPLPFSNTIYIDGQHYMPTDADMIFGDPDSDDESLEPFEIEIVNDTPSEIEIAEDTDMFDLESPSSTSSLDSDTTEEPVIETVDETDMFADLWSQSRTSSQDPDITEEPVIETVDETDMFADLWSPFSLDPDITEEPVIETVDDTDIFTCFGSPSRTSSLDRDATEVRPSIQSDGTRTVIEESLNVIREYEIIRDATILMMDGRTTADEPRDFVVRSSRWDRLPCFSDSEASLTQPAGQEGRMETHGGGVAVPDLDIISVSSDHEYEFEILNNNTAVSSTSTSEVPVTEDDETDFLHTRVVEEKLPPKWDNITDDARSSLGASQSGSSGRDVESQSVDIQILLRQALKDLNHIYHINENWEPRAMADNWAVHDLRESIDHSACDAYIPCNSNLNYVPSNRDAINRWLDQSDRQGEHGVTQFHCNSYCSNSVIEPRLSQSAVNMPTGNNKRKMEEIEDEITECRSDTVLMSRQITRAKRRRIYQINDQGEDDITQFHHNSHSGNNKASVPAVEPRLSKSATEMGTAKRKRKLDEMDDKVLKSKSDSCLMSRRTARPKRRRI